MARKKTAVAPSTPVEVNGTTAAEALPPESEHGPQEKRRPVFTLKCASGKDTWIEVAVWQNEMPNCFAGALSSNGRSY